MIVAAAGWSGAMLGLASAVLLAVQGFRAQSDPGAVSVGQLRVYVRTMLGGAVLAMTALELALLTDRFEVTYVAENHARATPLLFTITSAWAALEGSLVLWVLVLAGYTAVVARGVRDSGDRLGTGALAVMGIVATFFFGLITTAANPFRVLSDPPVDGPGPNGLLQNHIMVAFHPPLLYLGFVGFTVPFAFAVAALVAGHGGLDWLRRTRRANLVAWTGLSAGLVVGAAWSYEVLGWGGYWAWDPVENAALIPWLVGTAFIHSSVVQLRRGMLQAWNFVLVIATFALTILGTFLTRSSVIASVHSFTQSAVGPALLAFFVLVLGGGFALLAVRGQQVTSGVRLESLASREGAFLVNNVLFSLFAFVVLLGTIYPVLVEAVTGAQVSVGRPFFDRMATPLSFGLLLTLGIGPFLPYRRATARVMVERLTLPALLGSAAAALLVVTGIRAGSVLAVVFFAVAIVIASLRTLWDSLPARTWAALWRLLRLRRGYWGGQLAHVGVAVTAVAIAVSAVLAQRTSVRIPVGQSVQFAGYRVTYEQLFTSELADRTIRGARLVLRNDGQVVRIAEPRLSFFPNQAQSVGAPSVWMSPRRDIYVALTSLGPRAVTVNLYAYPLMWMLWAGGGLLILGGVWALSGRPIRRREEAAGIAPPLPEKVSAGA